MNGTINKVILVGNLGDDVKMHHFDDKNCLARFPIATSESYTKKDSNEKVTQTDWHNIVVRNKLAEICDKYLSKGDKVYIEGKIKTRKWDDNGTTKYSTEIMADNVQFLSTKRETPANNSQEASSSAEEKDLPF